MGILKVVVFYGYKIRNKLGQFGCANAHRFRLQTFYLLQATPTQNTLIEL